MTITSTHNPRVKEAAKLRQRSHRDKQGRFLIDGARELGRAISAGVELAEVFVCESLCESAEARKTLGLIGKTSAVVLPVAPPVFAKLAFGERAEGVLGVAVTPQRTLEGLHLPANPLVAVVEDVEKPGNLGAILRTADAAGVSAVIAAGYGTDLYNPNVIRASLGTVFSLPVCTASAEATLDFLRRHGISVHAARLDGPLAYTDASLDRPTAIVLGSETAGLSDVWRGDNVAGIKLPMLGAADSLNVSAAAAVLFYEALRQRSLSPERGPGALRGGPGALRA
jgi:TrmH family RNA methyltransferase